MNPWTLEDVFQIGEYPACVHTCKLCGYTFTVVMQGTYSHGDERPDEKADRLMTEHLEKFHREDVAAGRIPVLLGMETT